MLFRRSWVLLAVGFVLAWSRPVAAGDVDFGVGDEQTLRAAGLSADGPELLDFFRKRAQPAAADQVAALVTRLGDKDAEARDRAAAELVALGPVAVPLLRQAAKDLDTGDAAVRARRCLQFIEGSQAAAVPVAAARLTALRKPEGAAEALLNYLPFADEEGVALEVAAALAAVAVRDGKPEPALVAALEDKSALRRAAAAEALSQAPGDALRPALRKLLLDPQPTVRLRVALALAGTAKDPKAVSTLVALLADVPPTQARLAEEYLVTLAGEQAPKATLGTDETSRQKARDAWAEWWLATEGPGLLDEFSKRTLTDEVRAKALALIKKCGDDNFDVREKATVELQGLGSAVAPILRQHVNDPDLEVSARVRKSLQMIEKDKAAPLSPVTARLVALRKPPGAAEALLAFLPSAEDDTIVAEVAAALAAVALRDGKPEPALVAALEDKLPLRRAVAAEALWQGGAAEQRDAVRGLLKDADATVRQRVALALAGAGEKDALPPLIATLGDLPPEQASAAEEFLRRVAGEQAPPVALGTDEATRAKCRDAWAAWWKDNAAAVDLRAAAAGPQRLLGYTLFVYVNPARIVEVGRDGKQRWELTGFQYAYDARMLPGDRVLVSDYNALRVTERNLKNEVLWEKRLSFNPISAQRLANGNTLIASNSQLLETDKVGKDVWTYNRPQGDILAAEKLRDGQVVFLTQQGACVRLDAAGREVKSFTVGQATLGGLEALANGHVLVALYGNSRVAEYDQEGRVVWQASVATPTSAVRLPNGNTLVASQGPQQVVELDRAGKVVWEFKTTPQRAWKVRRR